jgi:hypothetical protein
MAHEGVSDDLSRLIDNPVLTGNPVTFGDENRFSELVAVLRREACESLDLKGRQAESQLHTQLGK